jgi:hypothetical protein
MSKTFHEAIMAGPDRPGENGWRGRHHRAIYGPMESERGIVLMLKGWHEYAVTYRARFDSLIGSDGVLGPAWEEIGDSLRTMLNGDIGRLDGGTCDSFLLNTMQDNGVDTSQK